MLNFQNKSHKLYSLGLQTFPNMVSKYLRHEDTSQITQMNYKLFRLIIKKKVRDKKICQITNWSQETIQLNHVLDKSVRNA